MKNEKDIQYLKWNKKLFGIFKKSCEKNLELHEAQVYQPYYSLYFNIHNTKHSHKLIDLKNEYTKLTAGAKIEFEGEEYNLAGLGPFHSNSDRNIRKRSYEARFGWF